MYVASSDGLRICYDISGNGPSLMLLHGFGNDRSMWTRSGWIPLLEREFTVVAMDLRGCGASEKPESMNSYTLEAHLADFDTVAKVAGLGVPMVWGWSLGATIALHIAKRQKSRATVAAGTYFGPIFTPAYVEARLSEVTENLSRVRLSAFRAWADVQPDEIAGQLLVYSGSRDGNIANQLELQRKHIELAGGELRILSDLDHMGLVEAMDDVGTVVLPFLRKQS